MLVPSIINSEFSLCLSHTMKPLSSDLSYLSFLVLIMNLCGNTSKTPQKCLISNPGHGSILQLNMKEFLLGKCFGCYCQPSHDLAKREEFKAFS